MSAVAFDLEPFANEAIALNMFVEWAISARDVLECVRISARTDQVLADALSKHSIPFNSPDWTASEVGNGLTYVMGRQQWLIKQISGGVA